MQKLHFLLIFCSYVALYFSSCKTRSCISTAFSIYAFALSKIHTLTDGWIVETWCTVSCPGARDQSINRPFRRKPALPWLVKSGFTRLLLVFPYSLGNRNQQQLIALTVVVPRMRIVILEELHSKQWDFNRAVSASIIRNVRCIFNKMDKLSELIKSQRAHQSDRSVSWRTEVLQLDADTQTRLQDFLGEQRGYFALLEEMQKNCTVVLIEILCKLWMDGCRMFIVDGLIPDASIGMCKYIYWSG